MAISRKSKVKPFGVEISKGPVGSILSNQYRSILFGLGMDAERYDALMTRYIRKALVDSNRRNRADVREGLSEELLKESMTWKTFLKGLKFLNVEEVLFVINLYHGEGLHSRHSVRWKMADLDVDVDEEAESAEGTLMAPGEILGLLYKNIIRDLNIDEARYDELMTAYLRNAQIGQSKKVTSAAKASLGKELSREAKTWKTFVKGLVFLQVNEFKMSFTLKHIFGEKTTHSIKPVVVGDISSKEKE